MRIDKITFFLLCLMGVTFASTAQVNSPYSRFGIGMPHTMNFANTRAMGGISSAFSSYENINPANPASYSGFFKPELTTADKYVRKDSIGIDPKTGKAKRIFYIDTIQVDTIIGTYKSTSLEVGALANFININNGTDKIPSGNLTPAYLALGVPVPNIGGITFGLVPFSSVNYNLITSQVIDTVIGSQNYIYQGDGNLYKLFGGAGFHYKNLAFGLNLGYLFGRLTNTKVIYFPDQQNTIGSRSRYIYDVDGFVYDLGLQYTIDFRDPDKPKLDKYHLRFGLNGHPAMSMSARADTIYDRVVVVNDESFGFLDSISQRLDQPATLQIPATIEAGVVLEHDSKRWLAGLNLKYDKYGETQALITNDALANSWKMSAGGHFRPAVKPNSGTYLERVRYMAGGYFGQTNLVINNNPVQDFGITFGLSLPLRQSLCGSELSYSRLYSYLDVAFEIGQRGSTLDNIISENYYQITIGLNLNDNCWISKSKFN